MRWAGVWIRGFVRLSKAARGRRVVECAWTGVSEVVRMRRPRQSSAVMSDEGER